MTPAEASERMRARLARPWPARSDVEERAAIALADDPDRELLVVDRTSPHAGRTVRLFVRVHEKDRVSFDRKPPRRIRGWHSGYVRELRDVDRLLHQMRARIADPKAK